MKFYLTTSLLLFLCTFGSVAQTMNHSGATHRMEIPRKAHITPEAGQAWWGYFTDDGQYSDFGSEVANTYDCAIFIPGDGSAVEANSKVYAERLWLSRNANITNMKIWISKTLPSSADEAEVCKSVDFTKGGCVDYAFDEPYEIGSEGAYVGYTFTISKIESDDDKWPVYTTVGLDMIKNALFVNWGSGWYSNFELSNALGGNWGNLAMQVLLGDGFYNNAAAITSVGSGVVVVDGTVNVPMTIENLGGSDIYDFAYTVTNNGVESEPIVYDASENPVIGIFNSQKYNVPLVGGSQTGEGLSTVKIVSVNGENNEVADGREQRDASIITVAQKSNRKTVMENFLNTTDGFSPLSIVSNDRLGRQNWHQEMINPDVEYSEEPECHVNHDNYIGIMIHDRDVMATDGYINTLLELDSLQAATQGAWIYCDIDRGNRVYQYYGSQYNDPYNRRTMFGIEDDFQASQEETVEAEVKISAKWNDADSTVIRSVVNTTFQYDAEKAHYALAFALTEDGVHGEGDEWNLCNNVLPQTKAGQVFMWDNTIWTEYVNGPTSISDMIYNDVLIGVDEIYNGIAGSIKSPIVLGKTQGYIHKWDLSYYTNIQNKANLKIIAMLIDTNTGRIVNADRVKIGEDSSGINTINENINENKNIYNVSGQRVGADYKGIIVKNGKKHLQK